MEMQKRNIEMRMEMNGRLEGMGMRGYVEVPHPPVSHGRTPFSPPLFLPSSNHTHILPPHSFPSLLFP